MKLYTTFFLSTSLLTGSVSAATVAVPNFSFEIPDADAANNNARNESVFDSTTTTTAVTGWTLTRTAGTNSSGGSAYGVADATFGVGAPSAPFDGRQSAWVNLRDDGATLASANLDSTVSLGMIAANTLYTLDVAVGDRGNTGWNVIYEVGLLADDVQIGTFSSITDIASATPTAVPTYTFNTQLDPSVVGQELKIRIRMINDSTSGGFSQSALDNVRLDAALVAPVIPEPSTALLGAIGMLAFLRRLRN